MFFDTWSLALNICSAVVLFLVLFASRTAYRVLRYWNPDRDDSRQIRLENEIWLTSTLVEYALVFQIFSLVLFVLAADKFCTVIVGAMCATGSLLANPFGVPALMVKLAGVFFYGFWIVLHKLDIRSPEYPLVKLKYRYFFFLLPILAADVSLQTLYLAGLSPDIITSCCGVVFDSSSGTSNLLPSFDQSTLLYLFYGGVFLFIVNALWARLSKGRFAAIVLFLIVLFFLPLATTALISVFSSYIYSMPYHHCPFCILKGEYHYVGFFLFGTLFPSGFFAMVPGIVTWFRKDAYLQEAVMEMQRRAVTLSLLLLCSYTSVVSYYPLAYRIFGGEH